MIFRTMLLNVDLLLENMESAGVIFIRSSLNPSHIIPMLKNWFNGIILKEKVILNKMNLMRSMAIEHGIERK